MTALDAALSPDGPPAVHVTRGCPTPEELAALVVALRAARQAARQAAVRSPVTHRPRRQLRRPLLPGPGGWRESMWNLGGRL